MSRIITTPETSDPLPNGGLDIRGIENDENVLQGSENGDIIIGGNNKDFLDGRGGNDLIDGGAGDDELVGGAGNDTIDGGRGADIISGGAGNDLLISQGGSVLTGGNGEDTFQINVGGEGASSQDTQAENLEEVTLALSQITDFTPGEDRIVIEGLSTDEDATYNDLTGILSVGDLEIAQLSTGLNINEEDIEVANNSGGSGNTAAGAVYRFFDPAVGVHFYTADENEKDAVQANLSNYQFEGESYRTVDATTGAAEEVYRFFNPATGVHLYTTDENERDSIIENLPNFQFEGVKFYAYETEVEGSIPVYRFFEPTLGVHFYTPNEAEKDDVQANLPNYEFEGIAYYALPADDTIG